MTPKLLQKKSNRYLQLALPENLIANKRIGKREKYNHRPGAAANNLRGMEKRILGQWAFSWNMYKKRMEKQQSLLSRGRPEKMEQPLPPLRARYMTLPAIAPCFLVAPGLYILQDRINRALGGNVIQYLKYRNAVSFPCATHKDNMPMPAAKANHPFRLPPGQSRLEYSVSSLSNRQGGGTYPFSAPHRANFSGKNPPTFLQTLEEKQPNEMTGGIPPQRCANLISDAAVHFGHQRGEMVTEHCRKNNFNMIFSLLAVQILQNKARGDRRDRIADHYRNQLAEWRKIAFLYGGLPRQAALRLQRQAHLLGGDVDSNFLSLLESRLDVTLKRAFFFSTLKAARQWIQRGKIYVNNQRCTVAGALLQPADLIRINPSAAMEWRKERLRTLAAIIEKAAFQPPSSYAFQFKWNRNKISMPGAPRSQSRKADRYRGAGGGNQMGERRFPFSPALMRKWKEWSKIWSNSRYSFSIGSESHSSKGITNPTGKQHFLSRHASLPSPWAAKGKALNDRFTGKARPRFAAGLVPSPQSLYSSSALTHYLSATNLLQTWGQNGQCLAISNPQISFPTYFTRQPTTCDAAHANPLWGNKMQPLLQRRQTSITSLIRALPIPASSMQSDNRQERRFPVAAPKGLESHGLHLVGPGKLAGQRVRRDKSGYRTTEAEQVVRGPVPRCAIRLGQIIGGEKTGRCQWLHQRQSNVVDGLYALRWNRGVARKKSQGEKKDQWRWSCIKPLHLECSYKLGTVIFLFFPQKLAWPCSINVSLLRKKLGR